MSPAPSDSSRSWSSMLTWRAHDARRMESVRVQLSGKRIKANGRIVAAATDTNPAFAAYYDLYTDETGATKRLGMTVTVAERERQLVVARDEENMWLITDHRGESRSAYDGALDVDVVFSPFFNALPIRRCGLNERADTITVPTIYVTLPDMSIASAPVSYSSAEPGAGEGIKVHSPVSETTLTVDDDGFIVDYPSLAERI
ncbi:MAG: putative glycolipid-binding domain-containing protein [Mycobacterium sp.]|uniref:putative glycolipid-binding domain-containing protein n=1 Tax=Mycobacterium sp. TaxID=1785 RepID=UPI003BB79874